MLFRVFVVFLLVGLRAERPHDKGLVLRGADVGAGAAARAVEDGGKDGKFTVLVAFAVHGRHFHPLGGVFRLVRVEGVRTDDGMRADVGALIALDGVFWDPAGHVDGDLALFKSRRSRGDYGTAVEIDEGRDRKLVAAHAVHGRHHAADITDDVLSVGVDGIGGLVGGIIPESGTSTSRDCSNPRRRP
jgi:hypothetical protein